MTDEGQKQLVINLRWLGMLDYEPEIAQPCLRAANEIERLSKENDRLAEENDRFRRALVSAWRKIEEDAATLDPERSET